MSKTKFAVVLEKKIMVLLLIFLVFFACQNNSEPEIDYYGKIENDIYKNEFFRFSIKLQEEITVIHGLDLKKLLNEHVKENIQDQKELEKELKRNEKRIKELIALYKYPLETYHFNPNVLIIAENIKDFKSNIKDGRDFLGYSRFAIENMNPNLETIVGFEKRKIGKKQFWELEAFEETDYGEIKQSYYSTIINDYSLLIIITYIDYSDKLFLEKALDKIKFD